MRYFEGQAAANEAVTRKKILTELDPGQRQDSVESARSAISGSRRDGKVAAHLRDNKEQAALGKAFSVGSANLTRKASNRTKSAVKPSSSRSNLQRQRTEKIQYFNGEDALAVKRGRKERGSEGSDEYEYVIGGTFVYGQKLNFQSFGTVSENQEEEDCSSDGGRTAKSGTTNGLSQTPGN